MDVKKFIAVFKCCLFTLDFYRYTTSSISAGPTARQAVLLGQSGHHPPTAV